MTWMMSYLILVEHVLGVLKACTLFEWLLRSSHKSNFHALKFFDRKDFNLKVDT